MTMHQDDFKPGEKIAASGIYDVLHDSLDGEPHAHPHQVIAVSGAIFPPCRACGGGVRYRLHQAAEHVGEHHFFRSTAEGMSMPPKRAGASRGKKERSQGPA